MYRIAVITAYAYDSNGRLLHERTAADGLVIEVKKQYDVNGCVTQLND